MPRPPEEAYELVSAAEPASQDPISAPHRPESASPNLVATPSTMQPELAHQRTSPRSSSDAAPDDELEPQEPSATASVEIARRTLLKLDLILLPFLSLLFLLNSLDRSNIGNAETGHFTRDAGLSPSDINLSMSLFFAFFVTLQPIGAALGRRFGMARWVPGVMILWGCATTAHIGVRKRWELVLLRVAIGCLEAGFYPTTVSYLSLFYTRYEFARRLGLFYGQYAVAGALGGVISFFVFRAFPPTDDNADSNGHWRSWQILFLLEGLLTIVVAAVGFMWLPRSANTAWFLNQEERSWAEERIQLDRQSLNVNDHPKDGYALYTPEDDEEPETSAHGEEHDQAERLLPQSRSDRESSSESHSNITSDTGLPPTALLSTALLLPIWLPLLVLNIFSSTPTLAFSIFLPLLLSAAGAGPATANLLTAPPFICGAITLYAFTYWSDRSRARLFPMLVALTVSFASLGVILVLPDPAHVLRYIALCVLLSATFIASPLQVAWLSTNIPDPATRALVLGMNGWGNLAGVLSSILFAPRYADEGYFTPMLVVMGLVGISSVGYAIFRYGLQKENERRRKILNSWTAGERDKERRLGIGRGNDVEGSYQKWARRVIGGRVLGMSEEEWDRRKGGEKMTFEYGL